MDDVIRKRWTDALRSGKYQQGKGFLHTEREDGVHELCCLGVLCEIAVEDGVVERFDPVSKKKVFQYDESRKICSLPFPVMDWAGIPRAYSSSVRLPILGKSLADINDDCDLTFPRIADLIEQYL